MAKTCLLPACFIVLLFISRLMSTIGQLIRPSTSSLPHEILSLDIANRLRVDPEATRTASKDYGNIVHIIPSAVLYPSSINDIVGLIELSSKNHSSRFSIAARGRAHSARGQAMAHNGVVVDMTSLNNNNGGRNGSGIRVSWSPSLGFYADVGGEQLWIDVLHATLEQGLSPVSWTDYLYLTVGGTLSNAGISGQTFLYGPQINNVLEMDVITGKGEFVSCSRHLNSELFFAVLGGLGQFGIIARARIVLHKAPTRVKWVRMFYSDFSVFSRDQENLISTKGLDYVEGFLIMQQSSPNNWRSSFFSVTDQSRIASLLSKHDIIYFLEAVKYYDHLTMDTVGEELEVLLKGLSFLPGYMFKRDAPYLNFLNRVGSEELSHDVTHPWLNLFVPESRIMDFNKAVFVDIVHRKNKTAGLILVYPTNRKWWDDRMSAVIPDEDTFYNVAFLHSSGLNEWKVLDDQNNEILRVCDKAGIKVKQYLPHYNTKEDWVNHFGSKWKIFEERKAKFDPNMILSPGQGIFNSV